MRHPHQSSPEHRADIPLIHCFYTIFDYALHLAMVLPFVRALPCKIAEILRFFVQYKFNEICIAKVLLTPKPRSVAKFREC